jgi:hypothetical protein
MRTEPTFAVAVDPARNLARIRFAGNCAGSAMQTALEKVQSVLPNLKPGFTVLADFSGVTAMDLGSVPPLTAIMDQCRTAGMGMIVRILPPPEGDIGIKLLGIVHYRGKVKTVTVDNLDEAERVLR